VRFFTLIKFLFLRQQGGALAWQTAGRCAKIRVYSRRHARGITRAGRCGKSDIRGTQDVAEPPMFLDIDVDSHEKRMRVIQDCHRNQIRTFAENERKLRPYRPYPIDAIGRLYTP